MTNGDAGHHLIADLLRTLGREKDWPGYGESVSAKRALWSDAKMEAVAGTYRMSPAGFSIELVRAGETFELTTPRGSVYAVAPIDTDRLIIEETAEAVEPDDAAGALSFWGMTASRPSHGCQETD